MLTLVDRRLNGRNRSAVNRERFLRRYKASVREAVKRSVGERSIRDIDQGGDVRIPARDIREPTFRHAEGGDREFVLPGNREYVTGDRIERPQGGAGAGGPPGHGESTDDFVFSLSREEFLSIFFDDLELPHLARNYLGAVEQKRFVRAGYVRDGAPANLSVRRTLTQAMARRRALGGPIAAELEQARLALEAAAASGADRGRLDALQAEITALEARIARMPFLDDVDLRYRHRVAQPQPVARAVMFCLMDVSASMDERKKDLAKRFFSLLYLFLSRKYEQLEVVFIRHTDDAEEVDEHTFFHDPRSGGTVVLSALELMQQIVESRYPPSSWNVYGAQASDGDAFGADGGKSARFLFETLLPKVRYFTYVEISDEDAERLSALWIAYQGAGGDGDNFAMRRVGDAREVYPVFRELFRKEGAEA